MGYYISRIWNNEQSNILKSDTQRFMLNYCSYEYLMRLGHISHFADDILRHVSTSNPFLHNIRKPNISKTIWDIRFQDTDCPISEIFEILHPIQLKLMQLLSSWTNGWQLHSPRPELYYIVNLMVVILCDNLLSILLGFYCQAQLQLSAQLKAELALFPLNPATHPHPHPGKFISKL